MKLEFRAYVDNHMIYMIQRAPSHNYAIGDLFKWLSDDADVMQYTGMKDQQDNKIFIGDVLTFGSKEKYEVVMYNYGAYLVHFEGLKDIDGLPLSWGPLNRISELRFNCSVVGNIYTIKKQIEIKFKIGNEPRF